MRLGIIEAALAGHTQAHMKAIVGAARRRNWPITVYTVEGSLADPRFQAVREAAGGHLTARCTPAVPSYSLTGRLSLLRNQVRHWQWLAKSFRETVRPDNSDFIYAINIDGFDKAAAIFGSPFEMTPFGGMIIGPRFHHRSVGLDASGSRCDVIYRRLFASFLRVGSLRVVATSDPFLVPWCADTGLRESNKVTFVPDIGDLPATDLTRPEARAHLGLDQNAFVLLVYGIISRRKGIRELLGALEPTEWPSGLQVLVVGSLGEDSRAFLESDRIRLLQDAGRIVLRPGHADDFLTAAAFRAASAAWLGYRDFDGVSSVLSQACEAALPVIACHNGLIGAYTRTHAVGELINVEDAAQVRAALHRLMSVAGVTATYTANAARLHDTHTPRVFGETVCDAISMHLSPEGGGYSLGEEKRPVRSLIESS